MTESDYIRDYDEFLKEVHKPFIHPLSDVKSQKIGQKTKFGNLASFYRMHNW
jgi:hypothetical protein